ncbi:MAG: BMC domain-containing protein [Myxococcales bacterium]|nr:BMC domain-containing protein [Myxococcales bacterium]
MAEDAPALAALEIGSIARGVSVVDALVKRAEVRLLRSDPVSPGKLLLVFVGGEAEVFESLAAAEEVAGTELLDRLLLPFVHREVVAALDGVDRPPVNDALGILEMKTATATILAADAALKMAEVHLVALHLARGIGGKGYIVFTGTHDSVEASLEAGDAAVAPELRAGYELIARPHPDLDWALGRL